MFSFQTTINHSFGKLLRNIHPSSSDNLIVFHVFSLSSTERDVYQERIREWESVEVELRNKVQELESELVTVKKETGQQDSNLVTRVYDLESQLSFSDASMNEVKSRHDVIARERDELKRELQLLNTKLVNIGDKLRECETERDEYKRTLEAEKNKVTRLQNQLDNAATTKNRLKVSLFLYSSISKNQVVVFHV